MRTAINDLKGCWRVGRALATGALPIRELQRSLGREPLVPGVPRGMVGQMVRFGIVGIASTSLLPCCICCFTPAMGAQAANLTALLLTAIANTAANRAFTFGIRGRTGVARHQLNGLLVFAFCLADHQRVAVRTAPLRPDGRQGRGAVGARGGEPGGDAGPIRRAASGFQRVEPLLSSH